MSKFDQFLKALNASVVDMAPEVIEGAAPTVVNMDPEVITATPGVETIDMPAEVFETKVHAPGTAASMKGGKKGKAKPAAAAAEAPTPVSSEATPQTDVIARMLSERRGKATNERDGLLASAKAQEDLSDDEKVAFALLGALPGLVGAIGGGLAGGAQGAAAGLAGGLQGGAAGMQSIASGKQAKRKELLDRAEKAGDRAAKVDDQELAHGERLAQQGFAAGESAKDRTARIEQEKLGHKNRLGEIGAQIAGQKALKRMDIFGDLSKAQIGAAGKAGAKGPTGDLYTNLDTAFTNLSELEKVVGEHGNFELVNPQGREALGRIALDTAIAYAKIVDPDSVAREGEVQAAQKYLIPMGFSEQNDTTLAAIKGMRRTLLQKAAARQETGQLPNLPQSVQSAAHLGGAKPTAPGSLKNFLGF